MDDSAIFVTGFDTAIGRCGLAWSDHGVLGVQLPEASASATHARLLRRYPGATETSPTPAIRAVIDGVVALLCGEGVDLSRIELDLRSVPAFNAEVYRVARTIPPGETLTYGEIAQRLNDPGAARAVGQALGANPIPIIVPCHRVLAAGGRAGGFSAPGGVMTKLRLLEIERRRFPFRLT
jgi:methylated-DNA-[protein]-cysteine S-methyltransferase